MTVFLSHAPADREAAEALEKFLERRGNFVEMDNGETALRPVRSADVVVALVSKDFMFSIHRLRHEQRALDAWAEGRLVLVKLDKHFAPVGLRDLPFVDASFEAQREAVTWAKVLKEIQGKLRPQAPPAGASAKRKRSEDSFGGAPDAAAPAPRSESPVAQKPSAPRAERSGGIGGLVLAALVLAGLGGAVWAWRSGALAAAAPDFVADLARALELETGLTALILIGAAALVLLVPVIAFALLRNGAQAGSRSGARREAEPAEFEEELDEVAAEAPGAGQDDSIFVSYARANATIVLRVCEDVKRAGRKVWMDKDGVRAGEGWAGEIVRAIKGAQDVMVMCSTAAFESDHVKREIYLADRYKKRLLPVFIEDAQPPEDFEYFFAGVQWLKLHETPEADRSAILLRALGSA
jgi:hypothetical protein